MLPRTSAIPAAASISRLEVDLSKRLDDPSSVKEFFIDFRYGFLHPFAEPKGESEIHCHFGQRF